MCKVMVAPASAPDGPLALDAGLAMITVGMAWGIGSTRASRRHGSAGKAHRPLD